LREPRPESGCSTGEGQEGEMRQNRHEGGKVRGKNYSYIYIILGCLDWRQENKGL